MSEQQGWYPDGASANPATGTALTIEHGDIGNTAPGADSVSVRLTDTGELPFLQPRPSGPAVETGPDWIERLYDFGRRPATIVVAAIIAGLVFAAFATQTDRSEPSASAVASAAALDLDVGASGIEAEQSADGVVVGGDVLKSSAVADGAGAVDSAARSSGDAFGAGDERLLTVEVGEPEDKSTNPTTTTVTPTTAAPATSEPSTTTEATTTTVETTTTTEPTTTIESTTTVEPTTTTAEDVVAEADYVRVQALFPGSTDSGNAPALRPGDIVLEADGSEDIIAYRFRIYVQDDEKWKRVESSGWRLRRQYDTWFRRYGGRTIRWTVEGRTIDGTKVPPTPPLHIYVDSDWDFDDDD